MKNQTIKALKYIKRPIKTILTLMFLLVSGIGLTASYAFAAGKIINGSIEEMAREYILYVPNSYSGSKPVPLLLNFHGLGGTASDTMYKRDFRPIADTEGFLIVCPQGIMYSGFGGTLLSEWDVGGDKHKSNDLAFIEALIDALASEYNIDLDRVYATGMSLGGAMSYQLACQLSDKIAAIASVAGLMFYDALAECIPHHPIPILEIHGTKDNTVLYTGNTGYPSVNELLQFWVNYNNCNAVPSIEYLPDIAPNDGSTVEHHTYDDGDNGATVEHYKVIGGVHAWPGGTGTVSGTNQDIDSSEEIWSFFSRFDINGLITPGISVDLTLSKDHFQPGDACILTASINNPGPALDDQPFAVLLDISGFYFWYPTWTSVFQYEPISVDTGVTEVEILNFTFPNVKSSVEGARIYGALLGKDLSSILGDFYVLEFGWGN